MSGARGAGADHVGAPRLRLPSLAGMLLTAQSGAPIFNPILSFRRIPTELFVGSEERRCVLLDAISTGP